MPREAEEGDFDELKNFKGNFILILLHLCNFSNYHLHVGDMLVGANAFDFGPDPWYQPKKEKK